jgi:hypothetical protein
MAAAEARGLNHDKAKREKLPYKNEDESKGTLQVGPIWEWECGSLELGRLGGGEG